MEKLPPSGVDIFLLKEMENLVSDILASDAFILSDFKFNIIDRLEDRHYREADKVERLVDISDDVSNDKDSFEYKCRIEERNIIGRAKGEEAEKLRGQVDKLQAFMQGELKKDDAIGQYFRLQQVDVPHCYEPSGGWKNGEKSIYIGPGGIDSLSMRNTFMTLTYGGELSWPQVTFSYQSNQLILETG